MQSHKSYDTGYGSFFVDSLSQRLMIAGQFDAKSGTFMAMPSQIVSGEARTQSFHHWQR